MRISSPAGKFICFVQNTVGFRLSETLRCVQNRVDCECLKPAREPPFDHSGKLPSERPLHFRNLPKGQFTLLGLSGQLALN